MLLLPDNTSGMQSWLDNVAFFNLFVWRIFNRINYEAFSNDLCISNTILILANILAKSIHTCAKATGGKDDTIRIARDVQAANDQRPLRSRWLASDYVLYYGSHYAQSGSFFTPTSSKYHGYYTPFKFTITDAWVDKQDERYKLAGCCEW